MGILLRVLDENASDVFDSTLTDRWGQNKEVRTYDSVVNMIQNYVDACRRRGRGQKKNPCSLPPAAPAADGAPTTEKGPNQAAPPPPNVNKEPEDVPEIEVSPPVPELPEYVPVPAAPPDPTFIVNVSPPVTLNTMSEI